MAQINVREIVLDILLELAGQTEYSNVLIGAALDKYDYLIELTNIRKHLL